MLSLRETSLSIMCSTKGSLKNTKDFDQPKSLLVGNYQGSLCEPWAIVQCWNQASCSTFAHRIRKVQNISLKAISCCCLVRVWLDGCGELSWPCAGSIFMQRQMTFSLKEPMTIWKIRLNILFVLIDTTKLQNEEKKRTFRDSE